MTNYQSTLNLPKTKFSMRGNLKILEPTILIKWYEDDLYNLIRLAKKGKKIFFLHDGPPYANGNIHIGHALNKILKDIIIKFKNLSGFDAPYFPGWDCHGLPIEKKVEENLKIKKNKINNFEFSLECRKYANQQIKMQKKSFIRLGVIGDWKNAYLTMNFKTEANTVRALSKIIKNGYLYKGKKPVHWCFNCNSVLSDAEVEYYEKKSLSLYVMFNAINKKIIFNKFNINNILNKPIFIIAWTTTPWTLPANQSLALHPNYEYQLIEINNKYLIISKILVNKVMECIGINTWNILSTIYGKDLENTMFKHPFLNFLVPITISKHVKLETGTGIVHIAPAHGIDDYIIGKKYNLEIKNCIDTNGIFINGIHNFLNKKHIFNIDKIICQLLNQNNNLLYSENIFHNYPCCWRHKTPLVFITTSQWFINIQKNNLREKILHIIDKVHWIPKWSKKNIRSMVLKRPDWCISRQRIWGVPLCLIVHKKTNKLHPKMLELMEIIAQKIEKYGSQIWWNLEISQLIKDAEKYKKVLDTLDVWFDSGCTNFSVLELNTKFKNVDMCLEGLDQHRGWFMSSLINSTIINDSIPYKQVLTHSFIVDKHGYKMSKSSCNSMHPDIIIKKFGADILRILVASSDYTTEISISNEIFKRSIDSYRRIRNTARFLLANIHNFNPEKHFIQKKYMVEIDKWAIHKTKIVQDKIISFYNSYEFHNVVKKIVKFCTIDMSAFYLDIIKDRQYTIKYNSIPYRSGQTAIWYIIEALVKWIAPIISFTANEIWNYLPNKKRSKYVFTEEWFDRLFILDDNKFMNNDFWNEIFKIKSEVNKVIEHERIKNNFKNSLEGELILYTNNSLFKKLSSIKNELCFVFLTSKVKLLDYYLADSNTYNSNVFNNLKIELRKTKNIKCLRCWNYSIPAYNKRIKQNICNRCILNTTGNGEIRKFV